jgi:hypothetical protein
MFCIMIVLTKRRNVEHNTKFRKTLANCILHIRGREKAYRVENVFQSVAVCTYEYICRLSVSSFKL